MFSELMLNAVRSPDVENSSDDLWSIHGLDVDKLWLDGDEL